MQAAQSFFQKPLSYRDMREPGVYEKHKQVLLDSDIQGERFCTGTDALTNMMEIKRLHKQRSLRWVPLAGLLSSVHRDYAHNVCYLFAVLKTSFTSRCF